MKQVVFITLPEHAYAFRIAGVMQRIAAPEEAEGVLREVLSGLDTGVVIIDERLVRAIDEQRFRELERRWYGVLVVLPAPEKGDEAEEDYVVRLIRRALGYQVRIEP